MAEKQSVVVLEYSDLEQGKDLSSLIKEAFGYDGLGILAVRGVPGFEDARSRLLPLARQFANLPEEVKDKCVHKESFYSFGWSHGKEKFNGAPDFAKGSYYANPQHDEPTKDKSLIEKYPAFVHPNIWPQDPPEFSTAFKTCGKLIVSVGQLVAAQCDQHMVKSCPSYEPGKLERVIKTSLCCKARLLHYFPITSDQVNARIDSWCGWHNDHGSLTGLCPGMFLDKSGNDVSKRVAEEDPTAGLYIHTRSGKTVKAVAPPNCMLFQIRETMMVHSGGVFQATPHCVVGSKLTDISRESFAVFMEPNWDESMHSIRTGC